MSKYYPGIEKMKRSDFYTDFAMTENFLKKMICMKLYQFKDIVFTDEEMVKYNLLAIHQDSFVHQEQDNFVHTDVDDKKNSSSNEKDEQIFDMKNELANVKYKYWREEEVAVGAGRRAAAEAATAGGSRSGGSSPARQLKNGRRVDVRQLCQRDKRDRIPRGMAAPASTPASLWSDLGLGEEDGQRGSGGGGVLVVAEAPVGRRWAPDLLFHHPVLQAGS
ncbi:hypothetical protein FXO38_34790 [Capsicum annuum]|nr:hypothetical protein FXO38_34790 [Capsicum annuum]